ncbi:MAG: adenylyltransferase/cytidyltransferase family protein [Candidatus Thermoplasmatota archaeon]|nr:adenylyltransferase/cytidyltransferase family protein [Candidatus Thermoplasmatota archaeon]
MARVMATGVFDLLHMGHLHYLREAKKFGDELVVVVATDETVRKRKHSPIIPQEMRRQLVEALKPVDKAVIGYADDNLRIVEEIKPDIIALGYDQEMEGLEKKLKERGIDAKIVRCAKYADYDLNGTRKIIKRIEEKIEKNELYKGSG